jgi:hypothetical protein
MEPMYYIGFDVHKAWHSPHLGKQNFAMRSEFSGTAVTARESLPGPSLYSPL